MLMLVASTYSMPVLSILWDVIVRTSKLLQLPMTVRLQTAISVAMNSLVCSFLIARTAVGSANCCLCNR